MDHSISLPMTNCRIAEVHLTSNDLRRIMESYGKTGTMGVSEIQPVGESIKWQSIEWEWQSTEKPTEYAVPEAWIPRSSVTTIPAYVTAKDT